MKRAVVTAALVLAATIAPLAAGKKPAKLRFDRKLPSIGTRIDPLPAGKGREIAGDYCLRCHSGDLLRQQRLTEKQWNKTVDKMNLWGAGIDGEDRTELVSWLVANFGPENDRFRPVVVRPIGE